jgi:WW domain-containing oxidoreductase
MRCNLHKGHMPSVARDRRSTAPPITSSFGSRSTTEDVLRGIDLAGKTVLLTGCNSGLGFATLRVMTEHGAHVIAAARDLDTARVACSRVGGKTTPLACDLGDLSSVKRAISDVLGAGHRVDRVIANAGIMALPKLEQQYGLEKQFVVNYLGHFMLVTGIRAAIPDHAGARIVILASSAHRRASKVGIEFDNLSGQRDYQPWRFYGQANVARILFARSLARRLERFGITANSLHPGVIAATSLSRNLGWTMRAIAPVARLFTKSIPQGAATQCYLAAHPDVSDVSGKYFADCNVAEPSSVAQNDAIGERLWTVSEQLIAEHAS